MPKRGPPRRVPKLRGETRSARASAGKAARRRVPRSSHASWLPPKDRPDPVEILQEGATSRRRELLPIRYGRMSLSPFAFLRGSAAVMAHDLAGTPSTGFRVQLCGDAHVSNFGVFATPERDRVFDVNDFDETLPGPWEWDVKRLATSVVLVGRQNGLGRLPSRRLARASVRSYRSAMAQFASMRYLDIWYSHIDLSAMPPTVDRAGREEVGGDVRKARGRTGLYAFPKIAERVGRGYRIRDHPPLITHFRRSADDERSREFFDRYRTSLPSDRRMLLDRYHVEDVARKVVGVGSVGTDCSVMLLMADSDLLDPLILQLKEATTSALAPYAGPSRFSDPAERVVVGQRAIQEASDVILGRSASGGRSYYVRQLRDMKFSTDPGGLSAKELGGRAELCGAALGRAHARTGDPARIAGYLGDGEIFDEAVAEFADAYADQVVRDHRTLLQAIRQKRVPARVDV
ncbi:MAG: DUF2252 domain-containing protein [Thermoplasmata archaeon]|nr:DUF2252 domain-containing protein [Thermoplasmata archaeon]